MPPKTSNAIASLFSLTTLLQADGAPTNEARRHTTGRHTAGFDATGFDAACDQAGHPARGGRASAPVVPPPPPTQWIVASADNADANDPAIANLLSALHPLRATRFLSEMPKPAPGTQPATQPATTVYVLTVKSVAAGGKTETHEVRITDRGPDATPIGQYQDLIFELDRSILTKLKAEFDNPEAGVPQEPGPPPGMPPGMMPPGMPGGLPPGFQMPQ